MKMIDHWKPLGAFIENTIRPLIEEMKWFLDELDRRSIKVSEENIKNVTDYIAKTYLSGLIIRSINVVIITTLICGTLWKIYPSLSLR